MPHPRYSSDEIAERGRALYERDIRDRLDEQACGKFLVLDVETGAYELDSDQLAAVERARERRPDGPFYILRVGYPTAFRLGRKALATPC